MKATFSVNGHSDAGTVGILLRSLRLVAARLARPLTVEQIAQVAAREARRAVGARCAVIALEAEDGSGLQPVQDGRQLLASIPRSLIARAARTREPTFLRSLAAVGTLSQGARLGAGALAALPMTYEDRRLGVIVVCWSGDRVFSEDDRAFLTVLAGHCSLALALALSRRVSGPAATWRLGDMEIDHASNRVLIVGRPVHLTPSEFHMLVLLAEEPGRCRSRKELLRHLWHSEHVGDERACDAHLANLRKKIERDPSRPERIVTVRGRGYALQVPTGASPIM